MVAEQFVQANIGAGLGLPAKTGHCLSVPNPVGRVNLHCPRHDLFSGVLPQDITGFEVRFAKPL